MPGATTTARKSAPGRATRPAPVPAPRRRSGPGGLRGAIARVSTASILVAAVGALCAFGLVMVGSASSVTSIDLYGSPWAILLRQVMWMTLGVLAFAFACRFDYRRWRALAPVTLVATFVLLFAVLLPGIGVHSGGSSRWIGFGQFRVQPSEMMKLALILFAADLIVRRTERGASARSIAGPILLVSAAAALLIVVQPDMGTALVIACICLALLFGSGIPMGPVVKTLGALAGVALLVGLADPYRRARLFSFLNPSAHQAGSGYQVLQSLIGLGSGHLFGLGLGSGREKWGLLPNAHTDFIFSVVGEELGLLGGVAVLLAFGVLGWFGLRAASRAPDAFGRLVAAAVVVWIMAETAINIGAVTGLLPVTGIPLPFISFGGSSLVITMLAAGILVNIARAEHPVGAPLRLVGHDTRRASQRGRHPSPARASARGGGPPR
jgi:cell division protein FtsW